ncbi:MAG: hypothetical protein LUE27_05715 [Clostridia bacterium]|nr:hypothetical protein [Clostridia bacterium]
MNKKFIAVAVLAAAFAAGACLSGCNVSTNSTYDMDQVVAEVDITESEYFEGSEVSGYEKAVTSSTGIIKRDLVAYFLNAGYSYVSNGYSYEDTFNMLLDSLVDNAVLTQYSIMYLLKDIVEDTNSTADKVVSDYLDAGKDAVTDDAAKVARYLWLLGDDSDEVKVAWYNVLSSLNSALDNYESQYLSEDDTSGKTSDTRTTPGNVDTEKDDYYPAVYDEDGNVKIEGLSNDEAAKYAYGVYYNVYTGNKPYMLDQSGSYQDDRDDLYKDKSTRVTRRQAYASFVGNLVLNGLVDEDKEDLNDILSFDYINTEFAAQLEQQIISKYQDEYDDEQEEILLEGTEEDKSDSYVVQAYNDLFEAQEESYDDVDTFETDLSSMSDSSFLLYAPDTSDEDDLDYGTYGFVYNILLPFSTEQSAQLSVLQSNYTSKVSDDALTYYPEYYTYRNELLKNITTTDQRSAWFNGSNEYAFNAVSDYGFTEDDYYGASQYLFFENNLTNEERYEPLENYTGKYAYNGTVVPVSDDTYALYPNELTIDDMLDEFVGYIDWVLGDNSAASYTTTDDFYKTYTYDNLLKDPSADLKDREIDYSNFVYATGSVNIGGGSEQDNRMNVFKTGRDEDGNDGVYEESTQHKVLSAVNELQYAYTTDTSVLSQYIGYSVTTGDDTGYIGEFEYAAQQAIADGAGTFIVCAGDYGWHLIYVTYTFDNTGVAQYDPDWTRVNQEGTFEYYFYQYVKSNDLGSVSTTRRSYLLTLFNTDDTVTKYEKRYQDLLDLDSDS